MMENKTNQSKDIEIDQETFSKLTRTEGIPKFNQICRVCFCKTNKNNQQLDTRIILLQNAHKIRSLLKESTGVQILDLDFLPNHICDMCFKTLTAWYRFRTQTQRSNEILKKYLNKLISSLDSNSILSNDLTIHVQNENLNVVPTQNVTQIIQDFQISIIQDKTEIVGFVFHCDSCTMTFTDQVSLERHQEQEHSQKLELTETENQKQLIMQLETDIPTNAKLKETMQNLELDNFSCEEENDHDLSTLLNAHEQINASTKKLLDKCKVNCHVAGCQTKVLLVTEIIRHFRKEHMSEVNPYKCSNCFEQFKKKTALFGHIKKYYSFKCPVCSKKTKSGYTLKYHVIRNHPTEGPFTCLKCSQIFTQPGALLIHITTECNKKNFVCSICSMDFFSKNDLDLHSNSHEGIQKLNFQEIENVNNIEIVKKMESNTSKKDFLKNDTNSQMETDIPNVEEQFALVKEELVSENDIQNKSEGDTPFQIYSSVGSDNFKQEIHLQTELPPDFRTYQLKTIENNQSTEANTNTSLLKDTVENLELDNFSSEEKNTDRINDEISTFSKSHHKISEESKKLLDKCKVNCHVAGCQKKFLSLVEIWLHFRKEHISGRKPFKCSKCSKTFHDLKLLRLHIKKYYSFKCPFCSKLQKSNSVLRKHVIQIHSTDRPFKCSKCDKTFNRPSDLQVHKITHSLNKEFVCNICSKDFFSNNGLYRHLKTHEDIKELQCPNCGTQFLSKSHLRRHINETSCQKFKFKLKKAKHNDMPDNQEIESVNKIYIGYKINSKTSEEVYLTNETNKKETEILNYQEQFEFVKIEDNDRADVLEIKNEINFEFSNERETNKSAEYSRNESSNQMERDIPNYKELYQIIKAEEDFKEEEQETDEMDSKHQQQSIKIENSEQTTYQSEINISNID